MTINIADYVMSAGARDTMRCLFLNGPTWDGNVPSKVGRGELIERGYADHEFGHAWLTRTGIEFAVKVLELDKSDWPKRPRLQSTKEMRDRCRELASPVRDDYDRAVIMILDDFERLGY